MNRFLIGLLLFSSVAGCAHQQREENIDTAPLDSAMEAIERFSANPAGALPRHWEPMGIFRNKKQTDYQLVTEQNKTILHARAASASSGLMQHVNIDSVTQPWLSWRWKIGEQTETTDVTAHETEDSPARIILGFDGDKDSLPFVDQIMFETAKVVTGHDFPYATLMYVWESNEPIGTVLASSLIRPHQENGGGEWPRWNRAVARLLTQISSRIFKRRSVKNRGT